MTYVIVSVISAFLTALAGIALMWVGAFLVLPAAQTILMLIIQKQAPLLQKLLVTFIPWLLVYQLAMSQPDLTIGLVKVELRSAIVGIAMYLIGTYVYPTLKDMVSRR